MVFRGVTRLSLDAKGRMAMPARYRDGLLAACDGRLIVTVDRDRCLLIYPLPEWERIERDVLSRPNMNPGVRELQRLLVGHATDCEFDGQGRILLPPELRRFAALDKHVMLVGQGNKFELWDEQAWVERRDAWLGGEAGVSPTAALETLSL